jgi:hypothetical protein
MAYDTAEPFTVVTVPTPPQYPDDGLNRENIRRVRDVIASNDAARFSMTALARDHQGYSTDAVDILTHRCGTAGCIAGWAVALLMPGALADTIRAARLFGLDWQTQGRALFCPPGWDIPDRYTQAQAVAVLDHLIATGEVDWSVAEGVS